MPLPCEDSAHRVTRRVEIEWAGNEPFSGETSTFGMRSACQGITGLAALGLDFMAGSARATDVATD